MIRSIRNAFMEKVEFLFVVISFASQDVDSKPFV